MLTRWRTSSRSRIAWSTRLGALILIAAAGLLPVLPEFHLAFSSHQHRYCVEHQRFEKVQGSEVRAGEGLRPVAEPTRPADALRSGISSERVAHLPCAIANLSTPSLEPSGTVKTTERLPSHCNSCALHPGRDPLPQPIAILSMAPKHSPPATLA